VSKLAINPSVAELDRFADWLTDNGRSSLTAKLYKSNVRLAANTHGGIAARLTNKNHAPKTLHANAAALRAYAAYLEDGPLLVALKKIRLPAARRKTPRVELAFEAWRSLVVAIEADPKLSPAMRATLLVMALRGLRVGDVLRLKKTEITASLRSGTLGYEAKGRSRLELGIKQIKTSLADLAADGRDWDRVVDLIAWASKAKGDGRMHVARLKVLRQLKRVAKSIELEGVYNHRLRRTYATHWLRKLKGDPQAIIKLQKHMGWANVETALGYVDAVDKDELEDMGQNLIDELRQKPAKKAKR
jgi:integrase